MEWSRGLPITCYKTLLQEPDMSENVEKIISFAGEGNMAFGIFMNTKKNLNSYHLFLSYNLLWTNQSWEKGKDNTCILIGGHFSMNFWTGVSTVTQDS